MKRAPILELYKFDACPYCQRVMKVIDENKLKVTYLDIYDDMNNMQKLMMITGKKTVPCMFINGDPMFESLDIIEWLKTNLETLAKRE